MALPGFSSPHYAQISQLADSIASAWDDSPLLIALREDMAKALGHALALKTQAPILCIDRVVLENGSFLDVGAPVGAALPVVIKTLILKEKL